MIKVGKKFNDDKYFDNKEVVNSIVSPPGFDDATDVMEDGHGPLPARQYPHRVPGFLHGSNNSKIQIQIQMRDGDSKLNDQYVAHRTSSLLVMELRTVGRALVPTRTSASACRCSNRTSIVGRSSPTLQIVNN
jgi:hypothetical protein